jgi:GAF domain-containing protein
VTDEIVLNAVSFPCYFAALRRETYIVAHDAATDPRTSEFTESYLRPLGITAMLDVPVFIKGRLAGVLCLEHVGEPRVWDDNELALLLPWQYDRCHLRGRRAPSCRGGSRPRT